MYLNQSIHDLTTRPIFFNFPLWLFLEISWILLAMIVWHFPINGGDILWKAEVLIWRIEIHYDKSSQGWDFNDGSSDFILWTVEISWWRVKIFMMNGQEFLDDRSSFTRWTVEIFIIVYQLVTDLFNPFVTKSLTASVCKSDKMD